MSIKDRLLEVFMMLTVAAAFAGFMYMVTYTPNFKQGVKQHLLR